MLTTSTGSAGRSLRMSLRTSIPPRPGSEAPRMTRSHSFCRTIRRIAPGSEASLNAAVGKESARISRSPLRTISWSSASRMRIVPLPDLELPARESPRSAFFWREIMLLSTPVGATGRPEPSQEGQDTIQVVVDGAPGHRGANHGPQAEHRTDSVIRHLIGVCRGPDLSPFPGPDTGRADQGMQIAEEAGYDSLYGAHLPRDLGRGQAHQASQLVRWIRKVLKLLKERLDLQERRIGHLERCEPLGDVRGAVADEEHLEELPLAPVTAIDVVAIQAAARTEIFDRRVVVALLPKDLHGLVQTLFECWVLTG